MIESLKKNVKVGTLVYSVCGHKYTTVEEPVDGMVKVLDGKFGMTIDLPLASLSYEKPDDEMYDSFQEEIDYFKTSDLGLAAAICTKYKHRVTSIDKDPTHETKMLFTIDTENIEYADEYYGGTMEVSAMAFFNQIKNLKNMIYNQNKHDR